MANVLNKFVGKTVTVSHIDGSGIAGVVKEIDNHGVLVVTEAETNHEINEKIAVYVPHKDIKLVYAREDDNSKSSKELFTVGV